MGKTTAKISASITQGILMLRSFASFVFCLCSLFALPTLGILDPNANIILSLQNQRSLPILENLSNNLTHPNEVINTLFHETSNKQKHQSNHGYARSRGNSAETNYFLRNYGNKNTNKITTAEWNKREITREKIQEGGVLSLGNQANMRAYVGDWKGIGERDNARIKRRELSLSLGLGKLAEKVNDKAYHEQIFFEDKVGGNIGFFGDSQVRPDNSSELHKYNESTYDFYFDDTVMRRAVDNVRWDMGKYHLIKNNCQTFIQRVLHEYGKEYQKMLEKQK